MRTALLLVVCFCMFSSTLVALDHPFAVGERIRFKVNVMGYHVGFQDMHLKEMVTENGRRLLHAVADTRSLPFVKQLFNYELHDVFHVWMDARTLRPVRIRKIVREGSWRNKVLINIDQEKGRAVYYDKRNRKGAVIPLARPAFGILSLVYFLRARARPGLQLDIDYIIENKKGTRRASVSVKQGRPLQLGKQRVPTLLLQVKGGPGVRVRVTADRYRIPLSITVGTFKVHGYTIDITGSLVRIKR